MNDGHILWIALRMAFSHFNHMYVINKFRIRYSLADLSRHDYSRRFVTLLIDDPSVACPKLADAMKVIVSQLAHLGFLGEKSF